MKNLWAEIHTIALLAFASLGLCFFPIRASAQFTFQLNPDNASYSITGYTGSGGNLVIPSVVSNLPVTIIADYAFGGINSITSLIVPDSVTYIGHNSFASCSAITDVVVGNGVSTIGINAFYNDSSLTNIILGSTIENLDDGAFQVCPALASIYFNGNAPTNVVGTIFTSDTVTVYRNSWASGWGSTLDGRPVVTITPSEIATQPISQSVLYGSNALFSVLVTNEPNTTYQWYFSGPSNTIQAGAYAQTIAGFVYGAVVTNSGSGYGNIPNISFVGGAGNGAEGYATSSNGAVFSIIVTNAGFGYTSVPLVVIDPPNGALYAQTNDTLTVTNASAANAGNYFVVITNNFGTFVSSNVSLTVLYPASIATPPQDYYVDAHSNALLSVVAGGTPPFSYVWLFSNSIIPNATGSTLAVSNVTPADLGGYSVIVNNAYGSITSSVASLFMYPYLDQPFTGLDTYWGATNTLFVGAWGSGNLSYQWYFNGLAIASATNASLPLGSIQFSNAGLYSVVVDNSLGSVTNTAYQVVVNAANIAIGTCPIIYLTGTVGYSYTIQSSIDLADTNAWVTVTNITLPSPSLIWADTATDLTQPGNPHKFWFIREVCT